MRIPFDIESAKSGAKVVTRDGRPVRILDYEVKRGIFKIGAAVTMNDEGEELLCVFTEEGKYFSETPDDNDLFIEYGPQYRPYSNAEEMDAAIKEYGLVVKNLNGGRLVITSYDDENVSVGGRVPTQYVTFLMYYKWIDGTPCGVQEGGDDE